MEEKSNFEKALAFVKASRAGGNPIVTVVGTVIAFALLAFSVWKAWRAGSKRAGVLHEQAKKKEEIHQAGVDKSLAEQQEDIDAADRAIGERVIELVELAKKANQLAADHEAAKKRISEITTWDELDEIIR